MSTIIRSYRGLRWSQLKECLVEWHRRTVSGRELMTLSDRQLWDIGLTPDRYDEMRRPF
jgi:uncharacterized protein YjiS (DUF1127 family)